MKVVLVYPPICDPTMPYVSVPLLAAVLRTAGVEVLCVDANVEALDAVLRPAPLAALASRVRRRFLRLDARPALSHPEQLAWLALHDAWGAAERVPGEIAAAVAVLRDRTGRRFYDPAEYGSAADTVDAALRLVAAACTPLELDLRSYRTPFSFLTPEEVARDAGPDRDPFHDYFTRDLAPRLAAAGVGLVGVSVAFPGQLQPAWSLARALRAALPGAVLVAGGPALTQRLAAASPGARERFLPPFDVAVLGEGEDALCGLVQEAAAGRRPAGVVHGTALRDLESLPRPAWSDLPLDRYLSPEPVLPYDATRGCYWGRCAFCHYGPVAHGTAAYRERPLPRILDDLAAAAGLGARVAYLSHDTLAPALARRIAQGLRDRGLALRWGSDVRPEAAWTPAVCRELAAGGALAFSLGIESGSDRVLRRIGKGTSVEASTQALHALADAGIAAEAMVFTDFPGETRAEALATLRLLRDHRDAISLFMCGAFALTAGSRIAEEPAAFGLSEVWSAAGDGLRSGLFWEEVRPSKTDADRDAVDRALDELSRGWRLRPYPWAGSLSTAHTLLWYDRFGPGVFRDGGPARAAEGPSLPPPRSRYRDAFRERTLAAEAAIWERMILEDRRVGRAEYDRLASALGRVGPGGRRRGGVGPCLPGQTEVWPH